MPKNERLIAARKASGFTQRGFARRLRLARSYYGRIENGQAHLGDAVALALRISTLLGVPVQDLFSSVSSDGGHMPAASE